LLSLVRCLLFEDRSEQEIVLVEDFAVIMRVELTDESVLHHSLLKLDVAFSEHIFKDVLQGSIVFLQALIIKTIVGCADDALKESGIS